MNKAQTPSPGNIDPALRELARTGPLPMRVRGICMQPWIDDDAHVEIRAADRYWPGDVLAVRTEDGRILLHRLLGAYPTRTGLRYLTRGDRSLRPDAAVRHHAILGRLAAGHCTTAAAHPPLAHRARSLGAFSLFMARHALNALTRRGGLLIATLRRREVATA